MKQLLKCASVLSIFAVMMSGCAANYTYQGTKYTSAESFQAAVIAANAGAVSKIVPLPAPISSKDLIIAMPTLDALNSASARWYKEANGSEVSGLGKTMLLNLNQANYAGVRVYYEAAQKKNIYAHVKFADLDSTDSSIAPSANADVLYMVEPTHGSSQWFYASVKGGKQVFAYDRSVAGVDGKVRSFLDALQVQALRE